MLASQTQGVGDTIIEKAPILLGDLEPLEYELFLTNQRDADHEYYLKQFIELLDACIKTRQEQADDSQTSSGYRSGMVAGLRQFKQALLKQAGEKK